MSNYSGAYQYKGQLVNVDCTNERIHVIDTLDQPVLGSPLKFEEFFNLVASQQLVKHRGAVNDAVYLPPHAELSRNVQDNYFLNEYCRALLKRPNNRSRRVIKQVIEEKAPVLGDTHPPSVSKLYRIFDKWEDFAFGALKQGVKASLNGRNSYADDANQELFLEVMDDKFLVAEPRPLRECYRIFKGRFNQWKKDNVIAPDVKMISWSTFNNWRRDIPYDVVLKAQQGTFEATRYSRKAGRSFVTHQILERVEIDAAHINLGLLDDAGNVYTSVILYTVIDVYSRLILGYYLQVGESGGETLDGYRHCLINAVEPKEDAEDWPAFGKMSLVVGDAALVLSSEAFGVFKNHLNVSMVNAPSARPWHKPFIERWFGTLRTQFLSNVPGYMGKRFAPIGLKGTVKSNATLTISDFKAELHRYIVHQYNKRPHTGLKDKSPCDTWYKSIMSGVVPQVPSNLEQLRKLRCYTDKPTLGRHGVLRLGVNYFNDDLHALAVKNGAFDHSIKADVYYDKTDMSAVTVVYENQHFEAVAMHDGLEGVSEAQWQAMRKGQKISPDDLPPITPQEEWEGKKSRRRKATKRRKPTVSNGKAQMRFTDNSPTSPSTESGAGFEASELEIPTSEPDSSAGFDASKLGI